MELFNRLHERFLVRRFQRGDTTAFLVLVRRYERRLLYFLRRFERDPHLALDALQDVWLAAWKSRGTLRSPAAFKTWIYRIAHGKIVGAIRIEDRRRRTDRERGIRVAAIQEGSSAGETAELIHFALAQLSPEHREVLTLRFLEEMTLAEIAEAIDCPIGTVKSRLHYASQVFQTVIQEQEDASEPRDSKID